MKTIRFKIKKFNDFTTQKYFGSKAPTKLLVEVVQIFVEMHLLKNQVDEVLETPDLQHVGKPVFLNGGAIIRRSNAKVPPNNPACLKAGVLYVARQVCLFLSANHKKDARGRGGF